MADLYRRKALMSALGVDETDPNDPPTPPSGDLPQALPDPVRTTDPVGSPVELPGAAAADVSTAPPAAPSYAFRNKVSQNFDMGKFDNASHMSPKYQVARVLAGFDPTQGVTPDVLAALNKLNLGTFSGSGDKVSLANGDPKWNGMTGADLIQDFGPGGQNNWALQGQFPGDTAGGGGGMLGGGGNAGLASAQSSLNGLLQGDPTARIQAAIQALMQGGNRPNLQALLGQLGGGQ